MIQVSSDDRYLDWRHDNVSDFTRRRSATIVQSHVPTRVLASRQHLGTTHCSVDDDPDHYRASYVATARRAYCVPKAVLLLAAARASIYSSRLSFADGTVLQTDTLRARMGSTGDVRLLQLQRTVSSATAGSRRHRRSSAGLCARFGIAPIDFDGEHDALLHAFDSKGHQHMEYLRNDRGWYHVTFHRNRLQNSIIRYGPLVNHPRRA